MTICQIIALKQKTAKFLAFKKPVEKFSLWDYFLIGFMWRRADASPSLSHPYSVVSLIEKGCFTSDAPCGRFKRVRQSPFPVLGKGQSLLREKVLDRVRARRWPGHGETRCFQSRCQSP